jgi:hypothetical protein
VKKVICLVGIGLLFVSMVMMGCATRQKTIITKSNLSTLMGKWEGWTTFGSVPALTVMTTLEIYGDTIPLQGKITFIHLPDSVAFAFPADAKTAGDNAIINFANGMISDQGTLISQSGQDVFEFTLSVGEKIKMNGWFYYSGFKGVMHLTKK